MADPITSYWIETLQRTDYHDFKWARLYLTPEPSLQTAIEHMAKYQPDTKYRVVEVIETVLHTNP